MTDFLYPMIDGGDTDAEELARDLAASADAKAAASLALQESTLADHIDLIGEVAAEMAIRFEGGGRLFTFGNGGSSTDAAGMAAQFARPPSRGTDTRGLPARSLIDDTSVITALANDIGFDDVFARQLIAHARPGDMAVGLSTSGNSTNVIRAFEESKRRGLLTIGFAGNDGGQMAVCDQLDHLFCVVSQSVHRIQEAQSHLAHRLWAAVQDHLRHPLATATNGSIR